MTKGDVNTWFRMYDSALSDLYDASSALKTVDQTSKQYRLAREYSTCTHQAVNHLGQSYFVATGMDKGNFTKELVAGGEWHHKAVKARRAYENYVKGLTTL